ncbi:MAG: UDP-N-acetylmuramate--L-alanine ligase [Gemmatimonadota bacterium]
MTGMDVDLRTLSGTGPIHFVGVGGAGMCALAELVLRAGGRVSGCDLKEGRALDDLRALGAEIQVGHDADHVEEASVLVVSSAVPAAHPEVLAAHERGIPVLKRAQALGAWVNQGKLVAIAGTHGKTTTTAMATEMMAAAGLHPTALVGGRVEAWGGNLRFGSEDLFVVEADEYDRSFQTLTPDIAVITNMEADHLDIYGDLEGVRAGFLTFLRGVRGGGPVIVCADDYGAASLLASTGSAGLSYGLSAGSMLRGVDVRPRGRGISCVVMDEGRRAGELHLSVGGVHNLRNALGAAAAARAAGAPWKGILEGARAFHGVSRRFQTLGEAHGVTVMDDYAHHPSEIRATLEAARMAFPGRRVVAVFQPHLYSRTRDFAAEFGKALALADVVWVTDIFPAREAPIPGVTAALVSGAAEAAGARQVHYHPELESLAAALSEVLREEDVLFTLGAGSVEEIGPAVLAELEERVHA